MKDYPLSCFAGGAKSAVGGVSAFVAGMIGGTITATLLSYHTSEELLLCLVNWMMMIVYTLTHLWGLLFVPFLAIMFYGLVWKEWNRFVGIGVITIATTATWLLCKQKNPFQNLTDGITFSISMTLAVGFIIIGIILGKRRGVQRTGAYKN